MLEKQWNLKADGKIPLYEIETAKVRAEVRLRFGIDHSASLGARFHTEFRVTSILLSLFSLTVCMPLYKYRKEKVEVAHSY